MFNDPISDLLTRIRNAGVARKPQVVMPHSKLKQQVAEILRDNGFIQGVNVAEAGGFKSLELTRAGDRFDLCRRHDRQASAQARPWR
jgi:small subunit ribosomal protein S8